MLSCRLPDAFGGADIIQPAHEAVYARIVARMAAADAPSDLTNCSRDIGCSRDSDGGSTVIQHRASRCMTQTQLALLSGCSVRTIRRAERRAPPAPLARRISNVLAVPRNELWPASAPTPEAPHPPNEARARRRQLRWGTLDVARSAGVSSRTVQRYEAGEPASRRSAQLIQAALGLNRRRVIDWARSPDNVPAISDEAWRTVNLLAVLPRHSDVRIPDLPAQLPEELTDVLGAVTLLCVLEQHATPQHAWRALTTVGVAFGTSEQLPDEATFVQGLRGILAPGRARVVHRLGKALLADDQLASDLCDLEVQDAISRLSALPGVGDTTARRILYYHFGVALREYSEEAHRAGLRLGVFRDAKGAARAWDDAVDRLLASAPRRRSAAIIEILHVIGRDYCHTIAPACDECLVGGACPRLL